MTENEAKELVAKTLGAEFNRGAFAQLLAEMLKTADAEKAFKPLSGQMIQAPYRGIVSRYERLGKYTDPNGEVIDLLVVRLNSAGSMIRARAALRGFIAHYLKNLRGGQEKSAALVAFHAGDGGMWRFSLVRMRHDLVVKDGKVSAKRQFTPARRHSFLVGREEKTHTAQRQLAGLLAAEEPPTLQALENAFSVEPVTERFFREYRGLYERVRRAVESALGKDSKAKADFAKKKIKPADFAKKLLGQIVFLYFLQRKGWLGVPLDAEWGRGDSEFLRQRFNARDGANFYAKLLQPLFYSALRQDRPPADLYEPLNCRIPFLNGGLFTPLKNHDWQRCGIVLPDDLFSNGAEKGILDVLDRYNFTVAEDEPAEREVAVDPEMLGKIFENLIEENERKQGGAFYTPRDTVHFMCRESLRCYLADALEKSGKLPPDGALDEFIRVADIVAENEARRVKAGKAVESAAVIPAAVRRIASDLDALLKNVRVCDPAVGSGAFVVGMMHEIVRLRAALAPALGGRETPYEMKFAAIAESLYGADKDGGAVEIAQLRLWLSLVVDEESPNKIRPLPNLDYKLVRGDSLNRVDRDVLNNPVFERLDNLAREFFSETRQRVKDALGEKIREILPELTRNGRDFDLSAVFPGPFRKSGGFDIVIGNPPYVRQESIPAKDKARLLKKYPLGAVKSSDLFVYFYLRGLQILREGGVHAFVCSNTWLDAAYGAALQKRLLDDFEILAIYHNEAERDFETADINTIVSVIRNRRPRIDPPVRFVTFRAPAEKAMDDPKLRREVVRTRMQLIKSGSLPGKYIGDKWGGKLLRAPAIYHEVIGKCRGRMTRLGDIADVRRGITSGVNEFFYIDKERAAELKLERRFLRPLVKGPKECRGISVNPADLKFHAFVCREEKSALKGAALRYIQEGEDLGYHKRPAVRGRERWWDFGERSVPPLVMQPSVNDLFRVLLNDAEVFFDKRFYELYPHPGVDRKRLAAALNCTMMTMLADIYSRAGLGGGLIELAVYEAENLPVLNPLLLGECGLPNRDVLPLAQELKQPDRRAMDDAVFDALGLTSGERDEVRGETLEMVRKRLAKARTVPGGEDED